jgi:glyoxylase-like metal-dependent hydrolase (beta-lactamase superfamily II)
MLLKQFYLNCLAHASYLIGDAEAGVALVVDPQRDVEQYVRVADAHGLRIAHVVLTHLHADFVAGHLELRDLTGAAIYLGRAARAEYAFTPLADGDAIEFGRVRVAALETPGHTPESISLLVFDLTASPDVPAAVLTGDTLFVGDVGRPDLRAALGWSAADLAGLLYDSLRTKLMTLPDPTLVYPAHGAGSLCGRAISQETVSTIGEQRRLNYALQPMSKASFVDLVTTDQPDAPSYFTYDVVLNSRERPTLEAALSRELQPLRLDQALEIRRSGAQVLDTREPAQFAAAHLKGSVNIGLIGQFATWAGTVLDNDRPIVLVADPGFERESAVRLGRIGFDQVAGFLEGGVRSIEPRPDLVDRTDRLAPERAAERLASGGAAVALDVRTPGERALKTIAGSIHVPLARLRAWLADGPRLEDAPLAGPADLIVFCAGGYRSSIAASLLKVPGTVAPRVSEIAGGLAAWEAAGLPVTKPLDQSSS